MVKEYIPILPVFGLPLALGLAEGAPSLASTSKAYACFSSLSNSTRVKISPVLSLNRRKITIIRIILKLPKY